ncbi:MAG: putative thioesterase [Acidobacteria bacterium]|nr:MAG: putative thioesterase [Acidobacteriota bacterium]
MDHRPAPSRWLAYRQEVPYRDVPVGVEACPLQPPGRETRAGDPPITRIPQMVESLAEALDPWMDRPFALFGHSVGALAMFELARRLRRQGRRSPDWLFVSGCPAPDQPYRRPVVSHLPPREFWQAMHDHFDMGPVVLENEDLQAMLYPPLRAEYELVETYKYEEEAPLAIPLSVFGGTRDLETTSDELQAWSRQTVRRFRCRILEGNHMFVKTQREALLRDLSLDLSLLP